MVSRTSDQSRHAHQCAGRRELAAGERTDVGVGNRYLSRTAWGVRHSVELCTNNRTGRKNDSTTTERQSGPMRSALASVAPNPARSKASARTASAPDIDNPLVLPAETSLDGGMALAALDQALACSATAERRLHPVCSATLRVRRELTRHGSGRHRTGTAMYHWLSKGSRTAARRSPYGWTAGSSRDVAPAASARRYTASTSSTYR